MLHGAWCWLVTYSGGSWTAVFPTPHTPSPSTLPRAPPPPIPPIVCPSQRDCYLFSSQTTVGRVLRCWQAQSPPGHKCTALHPRGQGSCVRLPVPPSRAPMPTPPSHTMDEIIPGQVGSEARGGKWCMGMRCVGETSPQVASFREGDNSTKPEFHLQSTKRGTSA